jgi:tripartite-type tricarboxylate transporter receptor subunit TctC
VLADVRQQLEAEIAKREQAERSLSEKAAELEKAQGQGFDVIGSSPEQFRAHIVAEVAKWKRLVAEVGIKAE